MPSLKESFRLTPAIRASRRTADETNLTNDWALNVFCVDFRLVCALALLSGSMWALKHLSTALSVALNRISPRYRRTSRLVMGVPVPLSGGCVLYTRYVRYNTSLSKNTKNSRH